MAVYSPPNDDDDNDVSKSAKETPQKTERFYIRPSLGLKLWGPFVPASDNRKGLWTLVGVQTALGLLCFYRFRKLVNRSLITAANKAKPEGKVFNTVKNIADIPTLNRFSTTHKVLVMNNVPVAQKTATNGGTNGKSRFNMLRKVLYLISGTALLSQSMLEFCRLKVLTYDPWYEEARTARDKKFFNDIMRFYHEGIDPNEVKVKDVTSGNIMSTNIPEVRQSIALVRAQAESQNPIIRWYGPIEFKPMSFSDYLDQIEYYLEMNDILIKKKQFKKKSSTPADTNNSSGPVSLLSLISHTEEEYQEIKKQNKKINDEILNNKLNITQPENQEVSDLEPNSSATSPPVPEYQRKTPTSDLTVPIRGIILDPKLTDPQQINLDEVWNFYDPWMSLGLETSLSIKFIPTVLERSPMDELVSNEALDTTEDHPMDSENDV
ncbi:similar to Saccharomyces cerevisiae YCL044C MGR1 Subunit of the mitochondrial (mt) i-AAA protease supercomplex, which degrades misfolded mitochondrial proteins [Maudiozyma barnettii]|uniref:Similar to Saccharomyces cerevisiae YCL044C MGR1 Subunit of the mitochondrial (Mt) i-AAA protease supercomplex, which degrades misfolded mitochondrial proteins n=1 Tax=Maudiozyma barnettii TaxID=61262 RepID=A0A8H2ZGH7_9SACH|nr:Mgr1p [Kazachstania barnettii]CAB4253339.1 similar to Saccharomyces cerevisiae YCL044C MGR1 Subunit of the mitochondrial (mt) i-AAA protease supercomplex, which degrades misfolded mitochondrial proteins [Kazachstania barnettii]CAD1780870.1 similar to Saccharomyces cerevisiae YCL044C MGR1 Subunit of the mitochondrial (mt) i-AAA protease supercomplex, which degrades misfolded mitochondrial proteins [Kazachstania barnettii]